MHKKPSLMVLAMLVTGALVEGAPVVTHLAGRDWSGSLPAPSDSRAKVERGNGAWKFPSIPSPSKSDAALHSRIALAGNEPELSCLSPDGLHNGVLPWQGKQTRDFFAFSNFNTNSDKIVMDLGQVQPVAAVATYSWQDQYRGLVNGARAPQVYVLYGSAAEQPDPTNLAGGGWVRIAEVDTRPNQTGTNWFGQYASYISGDRGALLGNFRWLVWDVKRTLKPGHRPEWTGTWFAELDVHTPETLKTAGDATMAGSQLDEIVLSFKTHFDIGFTHPAPEIVSLYRTQMIDHALDLIDQSRKLPTDQRFAWTIPSWVMWQILWPGQDPARRARVVRAVKEGSLVVHALPVTLHTESLDLGDLVAGLEIHTKVAHELGIPLSRAGKMTDVPSHSWILPTLLKHAGIDFLHIGVNSCNERPDVPLLYNWEGPDGSRLLTMHNQGYGSDEQQEAGLYPPKDWPYKHWLAMITTGDNQGPPTQDQVLGLLAEAKRNLPGVKVHLGKMEDFADAIAAEEKAGTQVPVVRADMPDCWIHGMGSLPRQDALAHKTHAELSAAESLDTHLRAWGPPCPDIRADSFTAHERSLMYGEHTWGGSRNLEGRNAYADQNFEQTVRTNTTCQWLQKTWDDHAAYIETAATITGNLAEREMTLLADNVNVAGDRVVVFNPLPRERDSIVEIPGHPDRRFLARKLPPSGYQTYPLAAVPASEKVETANADKAILENRFLKVVIDRVRGGIVSITDKQTDRELVDAKSNYAFGQYLYQRFDREQCYAYDDGCEHIDSVYGFFTGWNVRADLPPNIPYAEAVPSYAKMTVRKDVLEQMVVLRADAQGIIASKVTTTITLPTASPWLEIAVRLDDKQPDYWPESGSIYLPVKAEKPQFRVGRLGSVVDPVTGYARASNRTYGYVNTGAMIADADGIGLGICPLDHGLMSFGDKGIGTIDPDYVPGTPVARVGLYNNLWTINFPYWVSGTITSRVRIWPIHSLEPASLVEPALEARNPVLAACATGPAGKLPATASGLGLSREGVRLVRFAPNPGGPGVSLIVWESIGSDGQLTVSFPGGFNTATPANLRGEKAGQPIPITGGRIFLNLPAYAPASFILE